MAKRVEEEQVEPEEEIEDATEVVEEVDETPDVTSEKPIGFSEAEVRKRIEKARKEEKDKLYAEMKLKSEAVAALQTGLQEKESLLDELRKDLDDLKDSQLTETEKKEKEILKALEKAEKIKADMEAKQIEWETDVRKARLAAYRERRLREEGPELITEMVTGEDEDEIDSQIDLAKAKYAEIKKTSLEASKAESRTRADRVTATPGADQGLPVDLNEISQDDWPKEKKKLLQRAKQGL